MTTSDVNTILTEREKTHGSFVDHARITQRLKDIIMDELVNRAERGQEPLTAMMREAIDMNLHKIGRIIAGDPRLADHWDDIAGYALLPGKMGDTHVKA